MKSTELLRPKSLQTQIIRILADRIYSGEYMPGIAFPSENQLASEFSVSRATVRSAMAALEAKGLIIRRQGIGSFVRQTSISDPIGEFIDFMTLIETNGFSPSVRVAHAYEADACCELAQDLEIEEGTPVIKTESIFSADGTPVVYALNAIPGWVLGDGVARELLETPEICEPLITFLKNYCQQEISGHRAYLWADLVGNFEMDIPEFDKNTTVLVVSSIGYNQENRPIFQSLTAYPDKRVKFKIDRR